MTIAELRDQLAFVVGSIPNSVVHRTVPEQIAPPCYVLQPGDPFVFESPAGLEESRTFAESHVISFDVLLLVELSEEQGNAAASDELDKMLDELLDALRNEGAGEWWIDSMGQPGALLTTDWITHGQRVTVQRRVAL